MTARHAALIGVFALCSGCHSSSASDVHVLIPRGDECVGALSTCAGDLDRSTLDVLHRDADDWHVRRFRAERDDASVVVESEGNLQWVVARSVSNAGEIRASAPRVASPAHLSVAGMGHPVEIVVARRAHPSRAVWSYDVRAGSEAAMAAFVTGSVLSTSIIAMWAFVIGMLQLVYATERRNREGALAVVGVAFVQALRATVLQYHWADWWSGDRFLVAYALELMTLPLGLLATARFYGWVAGEAMGALRHRSREAVLLLLVLGGALSYRFGGLKLPVLRASQIMILVTVVVIVTFAWKASKNSAPRERKLVLSGLVAQVAGAIVDLVVAVKGGALFLGIGFAGIGFIVETLCQSAIVAARNSRAHDRVEELVGSLEVSNARIAAANVELKRVDKLKDEFLANTSHELRTPLHGILGLAEVVYSSELNLSAKSKSRLEMVLASGQRLMSLVNELLDFSRLQHDGISLREKEVPLRQAVHMVLAVLSPSADAKGLELVNEVPEGLVVWADEGRLQQVLTNLAGNAVKFTLAGAVRVRASDEAGRIVVEVQDTGIGIPPESLGRIFESFVQGDGSTARQFGGTGLGLTVSRKLVELHGGAIRVTSEPGVGSSFFFDLAASSGALPASSGHGSMVLPLRAPGSEAMASYSAEAFLERLAPRAPAAQNDDPAPGSLGRLLIADDDPVNLEVLRAQLEPQGYEVVSARDGQEALETLQTQGPFDGLLLDVMMPRLTGPEAAQRIREDYPQGTLPILMLTAKTRPEDVVVGLKAGANDYLSKPFHRDELTSRLDLHLDASKTTRALERFVSSALVNLAGEGRPAALTPGQGRGRHVLIGRFAMHGLSEFAARFDESTFFRRMNRIVQVLVEQVELHGGIVETMADEGLCVLFEGDAHGAISTMSHAVRAARDVAGADLSLGAVLHAGHVNVGVVGTGQWVSLRAMGESVLIAGALGRWGVSRGFGLLLTDSVVGKLDERGDMRRIGTARLGDKGRPVTLFEVPLDAGEWPAFDDVVDALEASQFAAVRDALASEPSTEPLAKYLAEAASLREKEVRLV